MYVLGGSRFRVGNSDSIISIDPRCVLLPPESVYSHSLPYTLFESRFLLLGLECLRCYLQTFEDAVNLSFLPSANRSALQYPLNRSNRTYDAG